MQRKLKTHFKRQMSQVILLTLNACSTNPKNEMTAKLYDGNSAKGTIERTQGRESISCKDKAFDNFICLSYGDLQDYLNTSCDE